MIAVPGYFTPPVRNWVVKSELEKAAVSVDTISHMHMYIHQPVYRLAEDFTWEAFLNTGSELAEELARLSTEVFVRQLQNSNVSYLADNPKVSRASNYIHCPFTRRSSSQTGLSNPYQKKEAPFETDYRKALLLAHQNLQDPRFKVVVDCLSGILFLGTPHASVTDEDTLLRHNQLLYSCAKISMQKQSSRLPAHDVFQLANLAAAFEQIANVPVLSVYEDADQRSNMQRILGKGKKVSRRVYSPIILSNFAGTRR